MLGSRYTPVDFRRVRDLHGPACGSKAVFYGCYETCTPGEIAVVYYGCYETCTPGEIAVVAERAAMNMAYQGLTPEFGVANLVRGDTLNSP
ncbi:hypothetical protein T484DRAFT_1781576 [Baffinella frigidus]|nr:hypothetical protein T484DRAFT_1781576 [Cryptophyta sp. CCMP2293]